MPQIFITVPGSTGGEFVIRGDDYHHLVRVRRVKQNDIIKLRDAGGVLFSARIVGITAEEIRAEAVSEINTTDAGRGSVFLELAVCVLKGKKFDYVIQKATEIGVDRIVPVISERTVPDLSEKTRTRLDRWGRIAREAAKQCMRESVPEIDDIISLDDYLAREHEGTRIIAHPGAGVTFQEFSSGEGRDPGVCALVGPEGGFSPAEIGRALSRGWSQVSFGFTSLRAETAALVIPSLIIYEWSR